MRIVIPKPWEIQGIKLEENPDATADKRLPMMVLDLTDPEVRKLITVLANYVEQYELKLGHHAPRGLQ